MVISLPFEVGGGLSPGGVDHPIFSKVKANDADIHIVNIGDRFTFLRERGGLSLGSQGPRADRPLLVDPSR